MQEKSEMGANSLFLKEKRAFLKGSRNRFKELWFTFEVQYQFIRAFRKLHFIGPRVTVFGRFGQDNLYYKHAEAVGKALSEMGFAVMTGGGPGIMEVANKVAYLNNGYTIGCNFDTDENDLQFSSSDFW